MGHFGGVLIGFDVDLVQATDNDNRVLNGDMSNFVEISNSST